MKDRKSKLVYFLSALLACGVVVTCSWLVKDDNNQFQGTIEFWQNAARELPDAKQKETHHAPDI